MLIFLNITEVLYICISQVRIEKKIELLLRLSVLLENMINL